MTEPNMNFQMSEEELQERIEGINQEIEAMDPFDTKSRRNRIKCAKCEEIIESKFRHDFKYCGCGAVFVDGGTDYCRIGGDFNDVIFVYDDDTERAMSEVMNEKTAYQCTAEDEREIAVMEAFADAQLLALDEYEEGLGRRPSLAQRIRHVEEKVDQILSILENFRDDGK